MYYSPAFRIKMVLLALAGLNALIFHLTIYRDVANWDPGSEPPARARLAGLLSLVFWIGVIAAGRAIAYGPATIWDDGEFRCCRCSSGCKSTHLGQTIRHSASLIALLEIVHLIGLTLLMGTILMVDLSLAGPGNRAPPVSRIARELLVYRDGARHYARERAVDSIFGGRPVLQDPGLLGEDGVAGDRPGFSFHRSPTGRLWQSPPAPRHRPVDSLLSLGLWSVSRWPARHCDFPPPGTN